MVVGVLGDTDLLCFACDWKGACRNLRQSEVDEMIELVEETTGLLLREGGEEPTPIAKMYFHSGYDAADLATRILDILQKLEVEE